MPSGPSPGLTLRAGARAAIRVVDSRFLAEAHPAASEAAARERREALVREFPDATHHCWALRLRLPAGTREIGSDAGEPAGTAGVPILQALRRAGVIDAQVVVARWFGGTKLGKGGLARAYRDAARAALALAATVPSIPVGRLGLAGPAGRDGEVRHALARRGGRILAATYDGDGGADLVVELPETDIDGFLQDLARLTHGAWRGSVVRARAGSGERDG